MKFIELYPKVKVSELGPHPYKVPDAIKYPELSQGGGYYACWVCRSPTNFHIIHNDIDLMVCSEECLAEATKPLDLTLDQVV